MKNLIPFIAIVIASPIIYYYLHKTNRLNNLKKGTFIIFVLAFIITELGRNFYRPYIYSHTINDYFIADTIGNSFGTVTIIFFTLTMVGKGINTDFILISTIILGLLLYEGSNYLFHYPIDINDLIATILFGLISIFIYWRLLKRFRKQTNY